MVADFMTKPLQGSLFKKLRDYMWDALNPRQMWLAWAERRPARSLLRRARWMTSAVSQILAARNAPRLCHSSVDTIVPQECWGLYCAYGIMR
jgi:hypothetical protein